MWTSLPRMGLVLSALTIILKYQYTRRKRPHKFLLANILTLLISYFLKTLDMRHTKWGLGSCACKCLVLFP